MKRYAAKTLELARAALKALQLLLELEEEMKLEDEGPLSQSFFGLEESEVALCCIRDRAHNLAL